MNARLAFKLFSNSMATILKFYRQMNREELVGIETTEHFVREMNDLIDSLNLSKGLYKGSESYHMLLNTYLCSEYI